MIDFARNKTELLQVIANTGGGDPYNMVSGIVRGVAVDRWCNELFSDGFITGGEEKRWRSAANLAPYVEITSKGQRWLAVYDDVMKDDA